MTVEGLLPSRARQLTRERLQRWAGRLASALAAFMLVSSAVMKIMATPATVAEFSRLGYDADRLTMLAMLELGCVGLYLVPYTQFLGAVLTTAYLGGAVATHVRIGDPFFAPLTVGLLVWAGLSLRNRRVRSLWLLPRKERSRAPDTFTHQAAAA